MTSSITEQLDDGFVQDPHAAFERLRAERPVTRVALPGGHPVWLVTRYADARAALADSRLIKDWRTLWPGTDADPDEGMAALDTHMLASAKEYFLSFQPAGQRQDAGGGPARRP